MEKGELVKLGKSVIAKVAALASVVSAIISDILEPAFKATLFCMCAALALTIIVWIVHALGKAVPKLGELNTWMAAKTNGAWFLPVFASSVFASCAFIAMYALNHGDPDGFLADHSSAVRKLQANMHMVNAHLASISESSEKGSAATHSAALALEEGVDNVSDVNRLLGEIANPGDARRVLALRGRRLDSNSFANSVYEGDLTDVGLFFKAGMKAGIVTARGERPVYRAVLENMPYSREVTELAISSGRLSPGEKAEPVELPGYMEALLRQFGQWLDNDTGFFDYFVPEKLVQELQKVNLGDCVVLGEFMPGKESLNLIYDNKLDIASGIRLREEIVKAYERYLEETENKFGQLLAGPRKELEYARAFYECRTTDTIGKLPAADQFPEYSEGFIDYDAFNNGGTQLGMTAGEKSDGMALEDGKCEGSMNPDRINMFQEEYADHEKKIKERIKNFDMPAIRQRLEAYKKGTEALQLAQSLPADEIMKKIALAEVDHVAPGIRGKARLKPYLPGRLGMAYIPPLPRGQIRLYGTLNSVGQYDNYSEASRKGRIQEKDSVFGMHDRNSSWFYADIDAKTGQITNSRFYGGWTASNKQGFIDILGADLVSENPDKPGYVLKDRFVLTFVDDQPAHNYISWKAATISGEANLLKARDGQKVRVRYYAGDKEVNRFADMGYGTSREFNMPDEKILDFCSESPFDFGYGEATVERND